jgi:hypothetical protein
MATTILVFFAMPFLAPMLTFVIELPQISRLIPSAATSKIKDILQQFALGTRSLTNPLTYPFIALSSLGIWFFYWLNFHLVVLSFSLDQTLTLNKELIAFTIASLGALVPTPGSIGGFHFFVSQALIHIGGINQDLALAFATVLHTFAFVIFVGVLALTCFLWQSFRPAK